MQACGEIACHFQCRVVEPRIVVFYEDDSIVQAFLCAEGVSIFEIDTTTLSDCLIVLMAAYTMYSTYSTLVCGSRLSSFFKKS